MTVGQELDLEEPPGLWPQPGPVLAWSTSQPSHRAGSAHHWGTGVFLQPLVPPAKDCGWSLSSSVWHAFPVEASAQESSSSLSAPQASTLLTVHGQAIRWKLSHLQWHLGWLAHCLNMSQSVLFWMSDPVGIRFHHLPRDAGEAEWPAVAQVLLLVLFEVWSDNGFPPVFKNFSCTLWS